MWGALLRRRSRGVDHGDLLMLMVALEACALHDGWLKASVSRAAMLAELCEFTRAMPKRLVAECIAAGYV